VKKALKGDVTSQFGSNPPQQPLLVCRQPQLPRRS
jgi:hypothetical protein